jgi:uncharacterized protein (TIGR02099 family)
LIPSGAVPFVRALLAWTGRILLVLYFAAGLTILVGRHVLLPEIAAQREAVEQRLSAALGLPVRIAAMTAEWPALHPHLSIAGLQIFDGDGRPALVFDRVEAEIGWASLLHLELRLHRFEVFAPQVDIRRDAAGRIFVAGLPVQTDGEGDFLRWLLEQRRILVRDARLVWHDELRGAPPLELRQVSFDLRKLGWQHSFGLTAQPPAELAARIDLRGSLVGRDPADLPQWRGEFYAELAQADVAAWQPWLDLPLEWSRGRGGVRAWLEFAQLQPTALTLDLQLADVAMRLRQDLPELSLAQLEGRLSGRRDADGYAGELKGLTLATPDGIVLPPTDARIRFAPEGRRAGGEFAANSLDLGTLAALAGRLPLPANLHERLTAFAPRGQLADLELNWEGSPEAPARWRASGRFAEVALAAHKELPGFSGISGSLKGDERSGEVRIDSRDVRIELPAVFPEPLLGLATLEADLGWRTRQDGIDLLLSRADFQNDDATGEAAGSYRHTGRGPGEIDLSAKLTKAAGNAVWRYMPLVVNKDARDWLRASIKGGRADTATLRLKGPLAQFPFRDGKGGIFQVKGSFRNATLNYADGWPEITAIDGELLFEGERMQIRGRRAEIMGVALADVLAEITDLEAPEELLVVTGRARGETQRFLDFIEASPVGAWIDHFTRPMQAEGGGELALRLDLPLRRIAASRVKGSYRFAANRIRVLPELPPVSEAEGEVGFTENRLQAKGLHGRLLGNPLSVDVSSAQGGAVQVDLGGTVAAQALRQQPEFGGWRALDHLSGEFPWRGSVTVKKPAAEIRIESGLEGLSSSLPEPFNKSVRTALPLKLTGSVEQGRSEWAATLGDVATLRLAQAGESWRGRAALGTAAQKAAAPLPGRGFALAIELPRIDADAWRNVLAGPQNGQGGGSLQLAAIDLRSASVHALNREFHDVHVSGAQSEARWRFAVDSREAKGQLSWDGAGAGRIGGRFAHLSLPKTAHADPDQDAAPADAAQELPAVDLVIDDFRVREMALGEVRVNAENQGGVWQAKLEAKNDAARLAGEGRWRPSRVAPETALKFRLDVEDGEKLLARMGMPDAVRRGDGQIEGDLKWAGTPFSLDIPSLSGRIRADIGKGQFKKLEPGVGRLLGVLSLQSLPRRITLDFRDIFSEGFAFDSIVGEAGVSRGMMQTDELKIRGPAAKILLSGQVNLVAETQNLKVRVQPALGETLAVGAMLAHPATGAVAWLAQKILDDPLDQVFAYEYAVTGGWSDPKVEKLSRPLAESKPATP